jgi:type IV pilus assembly protein PilB
MTSNRLGELLVRNKLINEGQLAKALEEQRVQGGRLGASLIKLGFLHEDELAAFLSRESERVWPRLQNARPASASR